MYLNGKTVLITGGTGSLGRKLIETLLAQHKLKKIICFSRDECKQVGMSRAIADPENKIRYFLGDIRDKSRLWRAFDGIDVVMHCAALKHVHWTAYNPDETTKTNIIGCQNIIDVAIDRGVEKVLAISTDKAVNASCLYGAAKLYSDLLFIASNAYAGRHNTRFSVIRFGNFWNSRGSVVPYFEELKAQGAATLPITSDKMTRFFITLENAANATIRATKEMRGGEIFVPHMKSFKLVDLAKQIHPTAGLKIVGTRPGEKVHESLLVEEDVPRTFVTENFFITYPPNAKETKGTRVPEDFSYTSERGGIKSFST